MNNASNLILHKFNFTKPINFDPTDPEFDDFKICESGEYRDTVIKKYNNVRIANNSVVFNYFNIFRETCIGDEVYNKYRRGHKFFFKYIFPKVNLHPKSRYISITDEWTTNYYHWILIALHRLWALKKDNLIEGSFLFLPIKYRRLGFVMPSLKKFGIKEEQIVYLRRKSHLKVKELFFPDTSQNHPSDYLEIRKVLTSNLKPGVNLGDKIYISRDGCPLRYIKNEAEFCALIEKYGFKKVIMDKYSYDDQVSICSNAKYIIGPHGAGLTNILFMKEGSFLFELGNKTCRVKPVTDYYRLANYMGIHYLFQECKPGGENKHFHFASLLVDLEKLEKNLKLMLSYE